MSRSKQVRCRGGRTCFVCAPGGLDADAKAPTADLAEYDFDRDCGYIDADWCGDDYATVYYSSEHKPLRVTFLEAVKFRCRI